jgi:polyferredoxin
VPLGNKREKVLRGLGKGRQRAHRYTMWRWSLGVAFTLAIGVIPLLGILRFDFWGGQHTYLGEVVSLPEIAKRFAFPFLGINIVIIVLTRFFGRYLCGFGCPYGALSRLQEWLRTGAETGGQKLRGKLALLAVVVLLSSITFSYFVDWRVFRDGSGTAVMFAGGFLGGMILSFFFTLGFLGLRFCRDYCPSGVYFALLGHNTVNGIEFAHPETCTDCKACVKVCPVDLEPRDMSGGAYRGAQGLYPETLSNFSNCIRCGDCVLACDGINTRPDEPVSLRMGWLPPEQRDAAPPARPEAESELPGAGSEAAVPSEEPGEESGAPVA